MWFFSGGGKTRGPEKKLLGQGREPATNSIHMWRQVREPNLSLGGGRQSLSPLPTSTPHNLITLILSVLSLTNSLQKQKSTFWIDHQEKWSSKQRGCAPAEPRRNKRLTFVPRWLTELCLFLRVIKSRKVFLTCNPTQRSNVCACANVARWPTFRLFEPSCLTQVTNNQTS